MRQAINIVSILLLCVVMIACSGTSRYDNAIPARGVKGNRSGLSESTLKPQSMLWEGWPLEVDLTGAPLTNALLLQGDRALLEGNRLKALQLYSSVAPAKLTTEGREARLMRVASTQLSLDRSREALATLSEYFRTSGRNENEVDARFSLLFAFAYGRLGDIDQSLAWFSRAERLSIARAGLTGRAESGVRLLMRTIPEETLYALSNKWRTDTFIHSIIGQERRRRADGAVQVASNATPFWLLDEASRDSGGASSNAFASGQGTVGVILPLTGPYAALGTGVKQGVELALEGMRGRVGDSINLDIKDDAGDSMQASLVARELLTSGNSSVILGPLLTDSALRVSEIVRQENATLLTFSKSDNFPTGDGIFRLGPTARSQIESLLEEVASKTRVRRLALVYPQDASGEEFGAAFREICRERGFDLLLDRSYPKDDFSSFLVITQEIEQLGVEAVMFPDNLKAAARFFGYFGGGWNRRVQPLGTANWENLAELKQSRAVLEGAIFVSPFFVKSLKPEISQFVATYRARFHSDPDFLAAQGFDAATLVLEALNRERETGMPARDALSTLYSYDGLTGLISVRPDGEVFRKYTVVEFREGDIVELSGAPVVKEEA